MYTSDHGGAFHIQFHRLEEDCPLHPIIKNNPHIALKIDNMLEAIDGKQVLLGSYEPIPRYKVAIIHDGGMPIEFIEMGITIESCGIRLKSRKICKPMA